MKSSAAQGVLPEQPLSDALENAQRVQEIISRGQRKRPGFVTTLLLASLSGLLLWASFTPLDWGFLAWISLVPILFLVRPLRRTRAMYLTLYLVGFCHWLITLQWMRLGDPTMYIALLALAAYLACYWPVFIWLTRVAVITLRLPLILAAPVLWTGLEFLRAHLITGFAWYLVGHSQYRWVEFIQISDLFGVYGVTFLVVMGNAAIAQLISAKFFSRWQLCWPAEEQGVVQWSLLQRRVGVALALGGMLLSYGYGLWRRPGTFPLGPRVALIQGNFTTSVSNNLHDPREIFLMHRQLTGLTVAEQPDFVVWPESMFPYGLYEVTAGMTDQELIDLTPETPVSVWKDGASQQALTDIAEMTKSALIIGANTFVAMPDKYQLFNSAIFVQPEAGVTNRYDKIHRVPFGEYIPLQESLPILQSFTPFRGKFGIDQGDRAHVFRWRDWQLIPLICFEDTVPQLVRKIAKSAELNSGEQNQVLVNLTNDGWFHGSSELDQHLITSQFRAIETRTPLVRAVNTGISAVIDGDGVVREALKFFDAGPHDNDEPLRDSMRHPRTGRLHKELNCAIVADVPLDPRTSMYVYWGDWFAALCLAACLGMALTGLFRRPRTSLPSV